MFSEQERLTLIAKVRAQVEEWLEWAPLETRCNRSWGSLDLCGMEMPVRTHWPAFTVNRWLFLETLIFHPGQRGGNYLLAAEDLGWIRWNDMQKIEPQESFNSSNNK